MTKSIINLAILALSLAALACAERSGSVPPAFGTGRQLKLEDFPNIKDSIFGAWSGDQAEFGDEVVFLTTYYFNNKNEIGIKRTCVGNGEEISLGAVVDGEVGTSSIIVKSSVQVSRKGERISNCTLTILEGSFSYNLRGDRLEFANKDADPRSFTRVKN